MDNETIETHEEVKHSPKKSNMMLPIVILIIIIVAGGVFYITKHRDNKMAAAEEMQEQKPTMMQQKEPKEKMRMDMTPVTPAPLTEKQQQEIASGTAKTTTEKTFDITGGSFYFQPNKITVNKGDKVTIIFSNAGGVHDFMIDEFNIKAGPIKTGETASVTFVADKAGTYEYYCGIGKHRQLGQKGTLIVQ